ncbi:Spo0E family sporulation regulatory protein-aspartic acid phosphatase [Gracilibacillus salitolerans]|uniref:Spo0E family sporulation regulatory protein-aspartic acid phosphatase n=1 Tax=Gracilibacillus salitolerans TaxID=2663022 RepID=A0A5Q2TMP1_9BACI|nr:aspartyl-phosphate phosphatase Spo0E family protein [Gracilibacillus salitolerans]QGH36219.1 Spo0E family sporulation regulatory protein-aspartic acid phosphatase [Gracilibacillus salitolerans]
MSNSEIDVELLLQRIEVMRSELVDIGFRDGLTAPSTLKYSELLDEQIKVYQKLKSDR